MSRKRHLFTETSSRVVQNWKQCKCPSTGKWIHCARFIQSCPTLCDPTDSSPPGSAVPGILQARTLEWVAISFSNAWKWKVKVKSLSHVQLSATPWIAAHQAPPFMGFSRQEYWSGVPLPSPFYNGIPLKNKRKRLLKCTTWNNLRNHRLNKKSQKQTSVCHIVPFIYKFWVGTPNP